MSNPKFKVGEEVILTSERRPQYNGEYIVKEVLHKNTKQKCAVIGKTYKLISEEDWSYRLKGLTIKDEVLKNGAVWRGLWRESSLRKKHQKGDMSFENLMKTLKFPEEVK